MHATNQSNAQGSAFAIAYESDLSKIQMEDLVVFSVLKQSVSQVLANTEWQADQTLALHGTDSQRTRSQPECPSVLKADAPVLISGFRRIVDKPTCKRT